MKARARVALGSSCPAGTEVEVIEWLEDGVVVEFRASDGWYEYLEVSTEKLTFELRE